MTGLKTTSHNCERIEVIQSKFSKHNKIKLESNSGDLRNPQICGN